MLMSISAAKLIGYRCKTGHKLHQSDGKNLEHLISCIGFGPACTIVRSACALGLYQKKGGRATKVPRRPQMEEAPSSDVINPWPLYRPRRIDGWEGSAGEARPAGSLLENRSCGAVLGKHAPHPRLDSNSPKKAHEHCNSISPTSGHLTKPPRYPCRPTTQHHTQAPGTSLQPIATPRISEPSASPALCDAKNILLLPDGRRPEAPASTERNPRQVSTA